MDIGAVGYVSVYRFERCCILTSETIDPSSYFWPSRTQRELEKGSIFELKMFCEMSWVSVGRFISTVVAAAWWYGSISVRGLTAPVWPAFRGAGWNMGWMARLKWAGSSKNYYIHPSMPPHHLSFQTDCGPRRYDWTCLIFVYIFFFLCQISIEREAALLWQKEKEANNTPMLVYWINRSALMASSSPGRWVHSSGQKWWFGDGCLSKVFLHAWRR